MRAPASTLPIRFERVGMRYGATTVLDDVTLTIEPGRPTVLIGPNGAGKSTLLRLTMGLVVPTRGSITWGGREQPDDRIAIVFQRPAMLRRSARANVAFALPHAGLSRSERHAAVDALLDRGALTALAERPARKLSGGEQQRLALVRALARAPDVLLLDEPANNLDPAATKTVEALVRSIADAGVKVVMTTHDLGQARRLAGDVVFLAAGKLCEHAPGERFFTAPQSGKAAAFLRGDIVD